MDPAFDPPSGPAAAPIVTVLLVDDSPTQRRVVQRQLERAGFRVLTAKDGVEAVSRVYADRPDVLVSDVMMPELTGYQLCRVIKSDWQTAHIPIVLLTSLGQGQDRFWGEECGADAYLAKEADMTQLPVVIHALVAERAPRPAIAAGAAPSGAAAVTSATVKSRVNYLLDRLLFQSTVANRVRELTRYLSDERQLVERFFAFLALLEDHEVAVLGFPGLDEIHLHVHAARPTTRDVVQGARQAAVEALGVGAATPLRAALYGTAHVTAGASGSGDLTTLSVPLPLTQERQGVLAIARVSTRPFDTENESTFRIVAAELSLVMSYFVNVLETEKLKADFTSMIIHDIRTPMTGIHGYAEILRDGLVGRLSAEQQQMAESICRLSSQVVELVSDALDVSKIEAGRLDLTLESVPLSLAPRAAADSLRPLVEQKKLSLTILVDGEDAPIVADPRKLEQVFVNLLSNAVKFTPEGGAVQVALAAGPDGWTARVSDTGTGISTAEIPQLFEKYRSAARGLTARGTGLGLVIVKSIVEAHGGRITVESLPGAGTTFTLTVPHPDRAAGIHVVAL